MGGLLMETWLVKRWSLEQFTEVIRGTSACSASSTIHAHFSALDSSVAAGRSSPLADRPTGRRGPTGPERWLWLACLLSVGGGEGSFPAAGQCLQSTPQRHSLKKKIKASPTAQEMHVYVGFKEAKVAKPRRLNINRCVQPTNRYKRVHRGKTWQ